MKKQNRLTSYSQELRKNMTKEERRLWYDFLKSLPLTVNRQKVIGGYIADFYIASVKIAIEIDGSQHFEEENQKADVMRDGFFEQKGIKVLRYSNYEINANFDAVCQDILNNLQNTSSVT